MVFFFNDTATTEIYTLSLHDALPICSRKAALISSTVTSRATFAVRSTTEPVGTGARTAKPCILPWSSGTTRPIALAAPVEAGRSEEHTSELQSRQYLVCRLLLEKKKI